MPQIILEFNKSLARLAGNEFGEQIFNDQVKNKLDYSTKNIVIFPDAIDYVAISFIQGFIQGILENNKSMTKNEVLDILEFKAKNEKVLSKINRSSRY
jgi:hypothetical protein